MTKKMIVRADDLGYSEAVNLGIAKTVHEGLINNVGFMVNMPTSQAGYDLIKDADIDLGLHVVICQGRPLTDATKVPSITAENGEFKASKVYRTAKNDFVNLDEVVLEIEAQYQRFVEIVGRKPDYFESHAVVSDNLIKGLQIVADRHQLNFLKFLWDDQPITLHGKKLYMYMESMGDNYDPYQTLKKAASAEYDDGYAMMVNHPGYLDWYILTHSSLTVPRTHEVAMLTDPKMKQWLLEHEIELIRYSQI
ncbi:ChbG/HpnK family deacetylase [Lapidilactobacillus dextrinicus]|uniref:ChbG/HpnK family deacetylase n=1 Tax=Lapidilactobacillus dextrinicus TaxID=51664 RepID=UPI003F285E93